MMFYMDLNDTTHPARPEGAAPAAGGSGDFKPYPDPRPVLKDDALYLGDNGRVLHGKCCGASAYYSGYDISGQRMQIVTPKMQASVRAKGWAALECEVCEEAR